MNYLLAQRFFDDIYYRFTYPVTHTVPYGYRIIETEEHKQERLAQSLQEKKASVEYLTKRLTELTATIENEERELLALSDKNHK